MSAHRLYELLQTARRTSFADGLKAGDNAIRTQLATARAELASKDREIHQQRITIARLRSQLDNAKGRSAYLHRQVRA